MTADITIVESDARDAQILENEPFTPEIGQWYWRKNGEDEPDDFVCIIHVGSNYVEVSSIWERKSRVHFDAMPDVLRLEPNAKEVMATAVARQQSKVKELLERVQTITAQLGINLRGALPPAVETSALVRVNDAGTNFNDYKASLVQAKKDTLPKLFEQIESANQLLVAWLKAETLPMMAKVKADRVAIERIDARIFNVELYAGLCETIEQIADGAPAALTEKIHLFQRRYYMDEEAMLDYQVGGMDFSSIDKFDAWMLKPQNLQRILPFPRCIVAFRVRRYEKKRETFGSFMRLLEILGQIKADELTFLYIRNGERVYRMSTAMDFGGTLFPHDSHGRLRGKLWATLGYNDKAETLISDNEYQHLCAEYDEAHAEYERKYEAWRQKKADADASGVKLTGSDYFGPTLYRSNPRTRYHAFTPDDVYYDNIAKKISDDIQYHNRVVLVLQGLLDRSPVFEPHPPWQLATDAGMTTGIQLIFDESGALVEGDPPDFNAYRDRCNASLKAGSVTVGQRRAWRRQQAKIYNDKHRHERHFHSLDEYEPDGNPGPPDFAVVTAFSKAKGECSYAWEREMIGSRNYGKTVRATGTIPVGKVLNVDAYTPGDFRPFFADPRTRAEYEKWAPYLLAAEEYHAGRFGQAPTPPAPAPKKEPSWEAQRRYQRTKRLKALKQHLVRNRTRIDTTDGSVYEAGLLWRVVSTQNGCTIHRVDDSGVRLVPTQGIRGIDPYDLDLASAPNPPIPAADSTPPADGASDPDAPEEDGDDHDDEDEQDEQGDENGDDEDES